MTEKEVEKELDKLIIKDEKDYSQEILTDEEISILLNDKKDNNISDLVDIINTEE